MATKLTTRFLDSLKQGDKLLYDAATPGLCIAPTADGRGKWLFRFTSPVSKKRREAGLGTYPQSALAQARDTALDMARQVRAGIDPIDARAATKVAAAASAADKPLTFAQAAQKVHEALKPGWKNAKHAAQWITTLERYVFPTVDEKPLCAITPKDCADALRPIWLDKPETASRTRQRMDAVFKWAWAHGYIEANPVAVVDHLLPKQSAKPEHQPAMAWKAVPAFLRAHISKRAEHDTVRAALEVLILTAARSGEVRGATWDEIDLTARVWTIPAERMKAKEPHRVALSAQAVAALKALKAAGLDETLVFPSPRGKVLSDMTLTAFLRRVDAKSDTAGRTATAHGFRSSFRDWASESGFARDLAERALSHAVSNKVEAAYHRTDLLEQRRAMMQAWADHLFSAKSLNVKDM
ncbi:tyrosine-type recombinase/integrase [Cupriavidus sp. 2TAF22]|uniref:tyrosine-type recombinase/integrase n=1 Tax=unclassified Cupriavidus TaxID=2640874 RepID=UPI003F905D76